MCVCNLSYPTYKESAPYCHLWAVRLHKIFPHYLVINGTIFEKRKEFTKYKMCVLISLELFLKYLLFKENWSEIWSKMYIGHHVKNILFLSNLKKTFSDRFSKNTRISNLMDIRPIGSQADPCGQTDRHDETHSRFLKWSTHQKTLHFPWQCICFISHMILKTISLQSINPFSL
jgi:hypothetical protein